jgi:cytoskeletal protein CcmA (bactofilin family)
VVGDLVSDGEVHVDGRIDGDIQCSILVIGQNGSITGEITAATVRVFGSVTGQISAKSVELAKTAHILGDITHDSLSVEAGAYVEGRFNRSPPDTPEAGGEVRPPLCLDPPPDDGRPGTADPPERPDSSAKVILLST